MTQPKRPRGNTTRYTVAIADEICRRLTAGESLRTICASPHMPSAPTICLWVVSNRDGFAERYARARQAQAVLLAEEIIAIADDSTGDSYKDSEGRLRTDHEVVNRSRLRVDTRKWYLSKVLPKVYGDKIEHTGKDGAPLALGDVELARRLAFVLSQALGEAETPLPAADEAATKH
jgi:hypothetical protein